MYTPSPRTIDQLQHAFKYHAPAGNQAERYARLRMVAGELAQHIATNTPESREQSLAFTKIEEAVMFANAAIARHEVWDGNRMLSPLDLDFGG